MPDHWMPVKLAAKVIGHISQGMYRTPAGAIKELISNAYDAGASYAKIHTGFPRFSTFSCEDDGSGISKAKFVQLMDGGIGASDKISSSSSIGKNGRPIIGRLGVGLLSLAQICSRFSIRSFNESTKTAFEAEIKFPPYSRQELDRLIAESQDDPDKAVEHGEYRCADVPYVTGRHGIIVTTTALRDGFRKTMGNLRAYSHRRFFKSSASYPTFDRFLQAITDPQLKSLYFASQYDQLLFGLALAAPIPYPESGVRGKDLDTVVTKIPQIGALQDDLERYAFRVEVDNLELRRPVLLPSTGDRVKSVDCVIPEKPKKVTFTLTDGSHSEDVTVDWYRIGVRGRDEHFQVFFFDYSHNVNGYPLEFSGYMFLQTTRVFPKECQGILIRVRNVAIGQYDVNVMTYPFAEGPRFSMLSSEVFVRSGLDDALKVDRDGFNTLDPQYIRLQSFIHSILHTHIFPTSWGEEKSRNKQRREDRDKASISTFGERLEKTTNRAFTKIEIVPKSDSRPATKPVRLDRVTKAVRIYESNLEAKTLLGRKKHHGTAARVIAAFEVANQHNSAKKRREIFYKLIEDIFNE
jgi:hypothetical protein